MATKEKKAKPLVVPASKKRNPLVAPALQRKAGAHRKDNGAIRSAQKIDLKQNNDTEWSVCRFFYGNSGSGSLVNS